MFCVCLSITFFPWHASFAPGLGTALRLEDCQSLLLNLENVFSLVLELLTKCWSFVEPGVSFSAVLDKVINSQPMNQSINFN